MTRQLVCYLALSLLLAAATTCSSLTSEQTPQVDELITTESKSHRQKQHRQRDTTSQQQQQHIIENNDLLPPANSVSQQQTFALFSPNQAPQPIGLALKPTNSSTLTGAQRIAQLSEQQNKRHHPGKLQSNTSTECACVWSILLT